jgi:hypothetical protein
MVRGIPARRACSGKGSIDLPPDLSNLAADRWRTSCRRLSSQY